MLKLKVCDFSYLIVLLLDLWFTELKYYFFYWSACYAQITLMRLCLFIITVLAVFFILFLCISEYNLYKLRKYALQITILLYCIVTLLFLISIDNYVILAQRYPAVYASSDYWSGYSDLVYQGISGDYLINHRYSASAQAYIFSGRVYIFWGGLALLPIWFDSITFTFLFLTVIIFSLCIFFCSTKIFNYKTFSCYLILLELILILSFITVDLFTFYVLFEGSLILMFLIIGAWGVRSRKIKAAYYFFFYTLFGSIFMFIALFLIYYYLGSFNIRHLYNISFSNKNIELTLWLCLFIPFAIKIPLFPFHLWLLEAHVEAPTIGSVILASILLKLGTYAILRFLLPILHYANLYFRPLIFIFSLLGILIASFSALRQLDIKRVIAYSSIAHMNLTLFGMYSFNLVGLKGSLFLMVGHGFISAALFFLIGVIYDRAHTRLLQYLTGLASLLPIFSTFLLVFTFANISFPGTINFISEILIFYGIVLQYKLLSLIIIFSSFFVVLFLIISFNRIIFGTIARELDFLFFRDINKRETFVVLFLFIIAVIFGLCPTPFLQYIDLSLRQILSFYN